MWEVGKGSGEQFKVKEGLTQGSLIYLLLFNVFFDKMVCEVNEKGIGKGLKPRTIYR